VDETFIPDVPLAFFKPAWGFWTSSELEDGSSEWSQRSRQYEGRGRRRNFRFEVVNEPRVLVLEGDDDVDAVLAQYGGERYGVEEILDSGDFTPEAMERHTQSMIAFAAAWKVISVDFDAAHVPSTFSSGSSLRSWDVESTVWFRPAKFLRRVS
jgi:hypothetical protein